MLLDIFNNFHIIHGILLVIAALGFFLFWARTRFWLPKYAHILAIIALALGAWMTATVSDSAPISKQGPLAKILLALALPAMVYFFFVFYGGQRAAYESRFISTSPCPHCQQPVAVTGESSQGKGSNLEQRCPHCGQRIGCIKNGATIVRGSS
jgi:endogenous inhibitor of DNA gyrase (YacG/DUF329 family)